MAHQAAHTRPPAIQFPAPLDTPHDPRLRHRITPWNGDPVDVALLGVPFDYGVTLNHGRAGAAGGPGAFREALQRYGATYDGRRALSFDHLLIADAGDLDIVPEDVAATHQRLTQAAAAIMPSTRCTVLIGGGHDATFASVTALAQIYGRVAGINVDAHLDFRPVVDGVITSGTPYRRIIEDLKMPGERLIEFGLQPFSNAQKYFDDARARGVECLFLGDLRTAGLGDAFATGLTRLSGASDALFVSVDLDAFCGVFAPGVSAPGVDGLTPEEGCQIAFDAGASPTVRLFELMEFNPKFDIDQRTGRLAVMLLCAFLAGVATRSSHDT